MSRIEKQLSSKNKNKNQYKKPDFYNIILLNDQFTPQDFVIWLIMQVFHKSSTESYNIMIEAHNRGQSIIDKYTYDIANTKMVNVKQIANKNGFPLRCIIQKFNHHKTKK